MSVSNPPDLPPTPTSAQEIPPGTPCPRCGYDLAGLSPDGQCPECGGANRNALSPYRLANASPAFIKRLHFGAALTQVWVALAIASTITWRAVLLLAPGYSPTVWQYSPLFYICTELLRYVAWWLISSPDPSNPSLARRDKCRRTFRILLFANLIADAVFWLASLSRFYVYDFAIDTIATILFAASLIASMVYLRSLAHRIPSDRFHRRATIILRVSIVTVVVHLGASPLLTGFLFSFGLGNYFELSSLAYIISAAAMYLAYFFLLHLTRRELKNIQEQM
ncbi:MAG: hypothetical protein IID31_06585 [Planctomycetes bacterium]|nr:hypothetical protein [Planctomycetota bacterium]